MGKQVLVLTGGWSVFRRVALDGAANVQSALKEEGFRVTTMDVANRENLCILIDQLREKPKPDIIFNTIGDDFATDGHLHAIIDVLQIPYCQSGHLACALATDKPMAKMVFAQAGIPIAKHVVLARKEAMAAGSVDIGLPYPVIVKPTVGGCSLGIRVIQSAGDKMLDKDNLSFFGEKVLVEEFIEGQDLTVAVVGDAALEPIGIVTEHDVYDYEAKYTPGRVKRVIPAEVPAEVRKEAQRLALLTHQSLGCRGATRTDFRYAADGRGLFALELNVQPGLTPGSSLTRAARSMTKSVTEAKESTTVDSLVPIFHGV